MLIGLLILEKNRRSFLNVYKRDIEVLLVYLVKFECTSIAFFIFFHINFSG